MLKKELNKTVLVAMSGGVDSSVAAVLLKQQGYDVIGITLKTWGFMEVGGAPKHESGCCSLDAIYDAKSVAVQYDFPHFTLDFTESFQKNVIENFIDEYLHGRTPNPCVVCNRTIKWGELISKADELGADFIATGHYAKLEKDSVTGRYKLKSNLKNKKDQTYALWGLTQEYLSRTLFPLADLNKDEVRKLAEEFKLRTAKKPESQEICFVADDDYERFLTERFNEKGIDIKTGEIMYHGEKVGTHRGLPFYTIGQRRGVEIAMGKPVYIKSISVGENIIELGDPDEIISQSFSISDINYVSVAELKVDSIVKVKIRYSDRATIAKVKSVTNDEIVLDLLETKRAVTPGQSAVMYDNEGYVLAGGIIEKDLTNHE